MLCLTLRLEQIQVSTKTDYSMNDFTLDKMKLVQKAFDHMFQGDFPIDMRAYESHLQKL